MTSMSVDDERLRVGVDIGAAKIAAVIGEVDEAGRLEVCGVGVTASRGGVRRGTLTDLNLVTQALNEVLSEAERTANCQVHSVYTGLVSAQIHSRNIASQVPVAGESVADLDVNRVMALARQSDPQLAEDYQVIHVLPQSFSLDQQNNIRDPIGLVGHQLEAHTHLIAARKNAVQNMVNCLKRVNRQVDDTLLPALAAARAVLTDEEREMGVVLLDIGHSVTSLATFVERAVCQTTIWPIAGETVTADIAEMFTTSLADAEQLKCRYGHALSTRVPVDEPLEVAGLPGRTPKLKCTRHLLSQVIAARYKDIFEHTLDLLHRSQSFPLIKSGVVLTGGGAMLPGVAELAEETLQLPVRVGIPQGVMGFDALVKQPSMATVVGLVLLGYENHERRHERPSSLWSRLTSWLRDI